jgi:hypothetical protein
MEMNLTISLCGYAKSILKVQNTHELVFFMMDYTHLMNQNACTTKF